MLGTPMAYRLFIRQLHLYFSVRSSLLGSLPILITVVVIASAI